MPRTYISGAISSELATAPRKFADAEKRVIQMIGGDVINPMKLPHNAGASWEEYMAVDILELIGCDTIYMLPCWQNSPGARLEHAIAAKTGMRIIYEDQE